MKVMAYADAGVRTGFERVAREILSELHTSGRADVTMVGINYRGQADIEYPYPVYPASYADGDQMGFDSFNESIQRFQPDVVWMLQDLWHIQIYAALKTSNTPFACYFPVDTPNLKWHYAMGLGGMSAAATYTQFGARESAAAVRSAFDLFIADFRANYGEEVMEEKRPYLTIPAAGGAKMRARLDRLMRYQNPSAFHVIPHGLRSTDFAVRNKRAAREKFGIPEEAFVVLNVNTNQFRKRLDITMRAFALLATWAPDARLVMHCAGHTVNGWDLRQLAALLNIDDRCIFVHEAHEQLSEDDLVWLYNTADVQLNTGGGEGWGLTSFEGAACGVPQLVPDWSATRELWRGSGVLLPVTDWRIETKFMNTAHANIDTRSTGAILTDLWLSPERRGMLAQAGLKLVAAQPSWSQVADQTYAMLEQAAGEGPAQAVSFQDLLDVREGVVQSELFEALWWEKGEPVTRALLRAAQEGTDGERTEEAAEAGDGTLGADSGLS